MATQRRNIGRIKKLSTGLILGLVAAAAVLPGGAAGYTDPGTGGSSAAPAAGTVGGPSTTLHRDGSKAVAFAAHTGSATSAGGSDNGFDWGDAMIGAGSAVALVAVIGAGGLTIRSRKRVGPAATAQG